MTSTTTPSNCNPSKASSRSSTLKARDATQSTRNCQASASRRRTSSPVEYRRAGGFGVKSDIFSVTGCRSLVAQASGNGLCSDKRFDGGDFLSGGWAVWSNIVAPNRSGNDECFRLTNNEWFKFAIGTFDDCLIAFDEVQNVYAPVHVMRHGFTEPMPTCFDKRPLAQTRAFLAPTVTAAERFEALDGVKKIKTYRELIAKPDPNGLAEQRVRLVENQINGRNFKSQIAKTKQQTVFFQHATKRPAGILRLALSVTRRRIEKRHHAKWAPRSSVQSPTHVFGVGQFRFAGVVRVEHIIPPLDERTLPAVS